MRPLQALLYLRTLPRLTARLLLGLFVLWQLVFLLASNFFGVYGPLRDGLAAIPYLGDRVFPKANKDEEEPPSTKRVARALRRYAYATGQAQHWGLFAPNVTDLIPFVGVLLRWDNEELGEHRLLSENEPIDRRRFLRVGRFRVRKFESGIDVWPTLTDGTFDPEAERWASRIRERVEEEEDAMLAYLRWRLLAFQRAHPDWPRPDEVILIVRLTYIPDPPGPRPWDWEDLGEHQVARWRPAGKAELEYFDPQTGQFERLR
jgi:hypothetical protein